jgi:hypothetical protein
MDKRVLLLLKEMEKRTKTTMIFISFEILFIYQTKYNTTKGILLQRKLSFKGKTITRSVFIKLNKCIRLIVKDFLFIFIVCILIRKMAKVFQKTLQNFNILI